MLLAVRLSVVVITHNEEANIGRTLQSVQPLVDDGQGEIIVVDCGSTDKTVGIATSYGAKVFVEEWKGYAAQKNSAIDKATGDWILSLDADESLEPALAQLIAGNNAVSAAGSPEWYLMVEVAGKTGGNPQLTAETAGFWLPRKNFFLGRWMKHGGFWPDPKLRLFRRGKGRFQDAPVHETIAVNGNTLTLKHGLLHSSYPTLSDYIDHMNRYSSLGAEMAAAKGQHGNIVNIVVRPWLTFIYNYFFRLGLLDGREGLLLHLYHAVYVSWKYAKVWELTNCKES